MEKVIYTDGHGVMVTSKHFFVRRNDFNVDKIQEVEEHQIPARRIPAILFMLVGVFTMLIGYLGNLDTVLRPLVIGNQAFRPGQWILFSGMILLIVGIFAAAGWHARYAVHIETAEGELEPVISRKRTYIRQIVKALKEAKLFRF